MIKTSDEEINTIFENFNVKKNEETFIKDLKEFI